MNKPVELTEEETKEVAGGTAPTPGVGTSPALRLPPLTREQASTVGGPGLGNIPALKI